jgi:hypothetical protein
LLKSYDENVNRLNVDRFFPEGRKLKYSVHMFNYYIREAVLRQLVPGFSPFATRSGYVGFVKYIRTLGHVSSQYFGSPANYYSTDCSTLIIIIHKPGMVQ